ncbi:MAG: hypothetical protein GY785_15015 [Gammaproteobacteria bacterium]|nr:hypothetical protein [Gammaproteobacteria bacterium]
MAESSASAQAPRAIPGGNQQHQHQRRQHQQQGDDIAGADAFIENQVTREDAELR